MTFANQIEFQKFGEEEIQSGGFIYGEYRVLSTRRLVPELYSQIQWAEARGLDRRYAAGIHARFVIQRTETLGAFFGTGPLFESERWSYNAVEESLAPADLSPVTRSSFKQSTYITYKQKLGEKFKLDFSPYHQGKYKQLFSFPRLASSSSVSYALTKNVNIKSLYQNIYDYAPLVPINKWFHRFVTTLQVSF